MSMKYKPKLRMRGSKWYFTACRYQYIFSLKTSSSCKSSISQSCTIEWSIDSWCFFGKLPFYQASLFFVNSYNFRSSPSKSFHKSNLWAVKMASELLYHRRTLSQGRNNHWLLFLRSLCTEYSSPGIKIWNSKVFNLPPSLHSKSVSKAMLASGQVSPDIVKSTWKYEGWRKPILKVTNREDKQSNERKICPHLNPSP